MINQLAVTIKTETKGKPVKIKTKTPLSTIQTQFPGLISGSEGSLDTFISELTSPQSAGPESLVFTSNTQELKEAYLKGSRAFVVSTKIKSETSAFHGAAFLFSPNVTLALAKISDALASDRLHTYHLGPDIHPTAVIAKTATLAVGVKIGPHVVIGENTKIGTGTVIGANSCIEGDTEIGENTMIYPLNFIGRRTLIGSGCEIKPSCSIGAPGYGFAHDEKGRHYQIPQTGRVVIEDDVTIGSGCTIDRATFDETRIGQGTKLDNLVHIAHNVKIGKYCLLTGGFMSAGSSTIGNHVVSGGRVSVTDHITICDNVQLGGMSGVSKDITSPGAYAGYPLQPIKDHLKSTVTIALLPKMRKDIVRILKHLGLKEEGNES